MYAVIQAGGKQQRVEAGQQLQVEKVAGDEGAELTFTPVLLVDGERVVTAPADLSAATVSARIVGAAKGPKIRGFTYKPKSRSRRRWGHRQQYSVIEITGIKA